MTVFRTDIEKALNELISNEEGMKFQGLAVILAKQKWPELIACERKWDLGLDAHAPAMLSTDGTGKGLVCSITAKLEKIECDAEKSQQNFEDMQVLIFATPNRVTNHTAKGWAHEIRERFGYKLVVMSREDIITSLMLPLNAPLCQSILGITVVIEESEIKLIDEARAATAKVIAAWLSHPRLSGKPLIALRASKLDREGKDTGESLDLESIHAALTEGRRLVLEAPAGRGKTTTLVQLAMQCVGGGLAFLIDLPAWARADIDILEFIARMPSFRSRGIDGGNLAKLYQEVHFSFLLNGWNEVSEIYSEGAVVALRQLEREFPAAGIIVATRTHHVSPPLPGSIRVKLLPLTRSQRAEYLRQYLGSCADELRSKLDHDLTLDDLTRTPLILSEVMTIFQSGGVIPTTKIGVLDAVMRLLEQSDEHQSHLQTTPLAGHAKRYLTELATQLTMQGGTTITEEEALKIATIVSVKLKDAGQFAILPEPGSILNTLCAHHVLERLDYPSVAFRFEHQQFQEFYATLLLRRRLWELLDNDNQDQNRVFTKDYVNEPVWEEPLRMLAEEIEVLNNEESGDPDTLRAGKLLIEMTMSVDPIFAGEISRLCGNLVWNEVRRSVGERLRSWYGVADKNHRQCALAGMLASGSDDFIDIIMPLLTSKDQQVRLGTYRAGSVFLPSSLGPDWRNIVKGWEEEARIDFVSEVTSHRWMPEIMEDFALSDPNLQVREAAIRALIWVGSKQDIARLLEALDEEGFKQAIQKMRVEDIPSPLNGRTLALYQTLLSESEEPLSRLRLLIKAAELGETDISEKVKNELTSLPPGKIEDAAGQYVITPAINIVQKMDPQWVSLWVVCRILEGSLWRESWISFVASIPEDMKDRLLQQVGGEDLQHTQTRQIAVLAAVADSSLAETIFSKLTALKRSMSDSGDPANQAKWAINRQLEDLLQALPPDIAVEGLSNTFTGKFDPIEFAVVIHTFRGVGRDESDLKYLLRDDLRQNFRRYLKNGLNFVLSQEDFSGEIKANFASALARVGKPEDMSDLAQLIRADIERVRKGRAARLRLERSELASGATMSYANWHVRALTFLDSETAEAVLLDILNEPEYENEAALALMLLARSRHAEEPFGFKPKNYSVVWEARAGRRPSEFDEERRRRYTIAIKQRINTLMEESLKNAETANFYGRLKSLTMILADLDSHDSSELVLRIMALPGRWDGWGRVRALEALLFGGVQLPAKKVLEVLNPTIEQLQAAGIYNDQNIGLLVNCLCLLPFVDEPSIGFAKIRDIISETKLSVFRLRNIIIAAGGSRSSEALAFLLEIADSLDNKPTRVREEWLEAIAAIGSPESKQILLRLVDPKANQFPAEVSLDYGESEFIASFIAKTAHEDEEIVKFILQLCDMDLLPDKRLLLSKIVARIGTLDAATAGLGLIRDDESPPVPYELTKALEDVFLEKRPYGQTGSSYTLEPQSSNEIRAKLCEMALKDNLRKKAAFSLLGQIELWRLEYGRPNNEPRHPTFGSCEMWPPIERFG